jgi:hypothetical protein
MTVKQATARIEPAFFRHDVLMIRIPVSEAVNSPRRGKSIQFRGKLAPQLIDSLEHRIRRCHDLQRGFTRNLDISATDQHHANYSAEDGPQRRRAGTRSLSGMQVPGHRYWTAGDRKAVHSSHPQAILRESERELESNTTCGLICWHDDVIASRKLRRTPTKASASNSVES